MGHHSRYLLNIHSISRIILVALENAIKFQMKTFSLVYVLPTIHSCLGY